MNKSLRVKFFSRSNAAQPFREINFSNANEGLIVKIGKSPKNDIVIDEKTISREHGYFIVHGQRAYYVEQNPTNRSTTANGLPIATVELTHNLTVNLAGVSGYYFVVYDNELNSPTPDNSGQCTQTIGVSNYLLVSWKIDIRNSVKFSRSNPNSQKILSAFFNHTQEIIDKYGGILYKTEGDAVQSLFFEDASSQHCHEKTLSNAYNALIEVFAFSQQLVESGQWDGIRAGLSSVVNNLIPNSSNASDQFLLPIASAHELQERAKQLEKRYLIRVLCDFETYSHLPGNIQATFTNLDNGLYYC